MSVQSNSSNISVKFRGQERNIEDVLSECFNDIQDSVNNTEYNFRCMVLDYDQDNDFINRCEMHFKLMEYFDNMTDLIKELRKVSKDVMGKPYTDDDKQFFKKAEQDYKINKGKIKKTDKLEEIKE
jgi:hypothetical protein